MSPSLYYGFYPSLDAIRSLLNFSVIYHLFEVISQLCPTNCPQATRLIFIKIKQISGLGYEPVYRPWSASLCTRTQSVILFVASKAYCGPTFFLFTLLLALSPLLTVPPSGPWCSTGLQAFVQTTL